MVGVVEVEELKGERNVGMKLVEEVRWVVAGDDRDLIERVGMEVLEFDVIDLWPITTRNQCLLNRVS